MLGGGALLEAFSIHDEAFVRARADGLDRVPRLDREHQPPPIDLLQRRPRRDRHANRRRGSVAHIQPRADGCPTGWHAKAQARDGAHVLDLCVDYVGRDGVADMKELASRLWREGWRRSC